MTRVAILSMLLLLCGAEAPAFQAVEQTWTLSYRRPSGPVHTSTLTLKLDGNEVRGTLASPRGSVSIDEGRIDGDRIWFAITRVGFGDTIRIEYTGRITGDTMTLTMKVGARDPIEATARRGA
jgi:hypothetical protein